MYLRQTVVEKEFSRISKTGMQHNYTRKSTIVHFLCDNCGSAFTRPRGSMDPKRLSNNYFHVCEICDSKKFAQRKSVERKRVWELKASSNLPIGKL